METPMKKLSTQVWIHYLDKRVKQEVHVVSKRYNEDLNYHNPIN